MAQVEDLQKQLAHQEALARDALTRQEAERREREARQERDRWEREIKRRDDEITVLRAKVLEAGGEAEKRAAALAKELQVRFSLHLTYSTCFHGIDPCLLPQNMSHAGGKVGRSGRCC